MLDIENAPQDFKDRLEAAGIETAKKEAELLSKLSELNQEADAISLQVGTINHIPTKESVINSFTFNSSPDNKSRHEAINKLLLETAVSILPLLKDNPHAQKTIDALHLARYHANSSVAIG